ncbi:MAG TPA: IS110 family transposase [Roseateles sp.]
MQALVLDPTGVFGVDVGSTELMIAPADSSKAAFPIPNSPAAILRWLKTLPADCRIGMEATGPYHRSLADLAFCAGHTVWVFNPALVAHHLRSGNARGKTDRLDARGIANYVLKESHQFHPYEPPSPLHKELHGLIQCRHQIVKQRIAMKMSLADLPGCDAPIKGVCDAFDALLANIDARIEKVCASDPEWQGRRNRLRSITGIGKLVSVMVAARISRVPYANSDALVAAFGLDPRARDSGKYKGKRLLSKQGNAEERRLLYCAAMAACRSPLFKALRDKLMARGLASTQAYCIIARKLVRIAFAVWHSNQPFNPLLVGKA